jgi:hypothetical protein
MHDLLTDPWALTLAERRAWLASHAREQAIWLPRLRRLVEPPLPDESCPAFLLGTPAFAELGRAIGAARRAADLDTATADVLQRFTDLYRNWLQERDAPEQA